MDRKLLSLKDTSAMILSGKTLLLAGDEKLLEQLPEGNWIAGTSDYFISAEGGKECTDKIFVTDMTEFQDEILIKTYDENTIKNVYADSLDNGVTILIIPPYSAVHSSFAVNAPTYEKFAQTPLIGWVASHVFYPDRAPGKGYVFSGNAASKTCEKAVAMHIRLKKGKYAELNLVNFYTQDGEGDTIEFLESGFEVSDALINGEKQNFADYILNRQIDLKLPLVTDLNSAMINTSLYCITDGKVKFFAPIFKGFTYKFAKATENIETEFLKIAPAKMPTFAVICILNYFYAGLQGKHLAALYAPVANGEICYQLVNQTIVTLDIKSIT
ncbi:MAG: hypothetical protein II956_02270 [Bacteroidales bacterium]|nr:hypothetical protein [Bacteroidales bacterium]